MAKKPKPPVEPIRRPNKTVCWPCSLGAHFGCTGCSCRICH